MTRCDFCGTWMAPRNLIWSESDPADASDEFDPMHICRDRKLCRRRAEHNLDLITGAPRP